MKRCVFPFAAVLGQERIKKALIWNYVNPKIGGVLISGQKGTAKSTLVRGSEVLSGRKIVELPLNVTEDRLVGAIDFEHAVKYGSKKLEPGILRSANGNILYADEVNLLSDHVTKALLEAAGEGICRVEREGISAAYESRFILIGSMNPEESGLRPQLLDRFGLFVDTAGEESPLIRCEIVRRRLDFEADPIKFCQKWAGEEENLRSRITEAQRRLLTVRVSPSALALAAELSMNAGCAGSRGEIALMETARAITAWNGGSSVSREAILEAAKYALPHRMRQTPPPPSQEPEQQEADRPEEESRPEENSPEQPPEQNREEQKTPEEQETPKDGGQPDPLDQESVPREAPEKQDAIGDVFDVGRWLQNDRRVQVRQGSGRRSLVRTASLQGRYVRSHIDPRSTDLAFDATLRAAAPYQQSRDRSEVAISITKNDFRSRIREKRTGNFIVFVVDASGSMGVGKRMSAVKGAILSLLSDAYQKRDRVAMITFRRDRADLVLGMTRSVDLAAKKLEAIATGGRTPLYAGLESARKLIKAGLQKEKDLLPVVVLVSDGRATAGRGKRPFDDAVEAGKALTADHIKTVIIDTEQDFIKLKLAEKLGKAMEADVFKLSELQAGAIVTAVNMATRP